MGAVTHQPRLDPEVWTLVRKQHGVIAHEQLRARGFSPKAIRHRTENGRLYKVHRGVYVVGRPNLSNHGRWMAAVLACGDGAVLSHSSAAALWRIGFEDRSGIGSPYPALLAGVAQGFEFIDDRRCRNET